jgi:hypothetical protein
MPNIDPLGILINEQDPLNILGIESLPTNKNDPLAILGQETLPEESLEPSFSEVKNKILAHREELKRIDIERGGTGNLYGFTSTAMERAVEGEADKILKERGEVDFSGFGSAFLAAVRGEISEEEFRFERRKTGVSDLIDRASDISGIALAGILTYQGINAGINAIKIAKSRLGDLSPTIRGIKRGLSKILGGPEKPIQQVIDGKITPNQGLQKIKKFSRLNPERTEKVLKDAKTLSDIIRQQKPVKELSFTSTVFGPAAKVVDPPSANPEVLANPNPPAINSPAISNFLTKAAKPLMSESAAIPLESIVPAATELENVSLQLQRNKGAISRIFTRFSELDSPTTQAFINFSEGDIELREKSAQKAVDIFKDITPQEQEELYRHLQEPSTVPLPTHLSEVAEKAKDIKKWSFKEINKRSLDSEKDIELLEKVVDEDLPIPESLKKKLVMPEWPDNELEKLERLEAKYQTRLNSAKSDEAALEYQAQLNEIGARRDKLENIVYFHQISSKPGLQLRGLKERRTISKKPTRLLGRRFANREEAQAAGYQTASLPAAVADTIYETNRVIQTDEFIKHINRNEDFAQLANEAPSGWRIVDREKFPAGKPYKYHPSIADALEEITYTSTHSEIGRAYDWLNTKAKIIGFYNPLFMTRFNLSQGIRAAGIGHVKRLPEALEIYRTKGDIYNHLRRNGLFNNVFELKPMLQDLTNEILFKLEKQKDLSGRFKDVAIRELNPINLAGDLFKLLHEGTWKIDEVQRIATWLAMKDDPRLKRNYSDFEIIELANDFHANYGKVPKRTRQALNRGIFTPTYKISMGRVLGRMHREAPALWPSLLRHYAMKLLFGVFIGAAANEYLKSKNLDDRVEVNGYRMIIRNPKSKKETVYSISDPLLELTKIENRPLNRTVEYNLAAVPAALLTFIRGPWFKKKDEDWKDVVNSYFKIGAPVIKELAQWEEDDKETFQQFMQGLGMAFIYKRNRTKLEEDHFRNNFLRALDVWIDRKTLFPKDEFRTIRVRKKKKK